MNYIIDPRIFYWISVLSSLKVVCIVVLIGTMIGSAIVIAMIADDFSYDDEEKKTQKKILTALLVAAIVSILGVVFIPGKETMIEMLVAKMATEQNVKLSVDTIKNLIDYIVEASKAIR